MAKKAVLKKGPARMRELGRVGVNLWLTPEQVTQLDRARGTVPRATWITMMLGHQIKQVLQYKKHG